jgi:hypothetical protein
VGRFKERFFKQFSKQLRRLDSEEYENETKYREICDILQAAAPSPEASDTDDDFEDARAYLGGTVSPMKPSMRRKPR